MERMARLHTPVENHGQAVIDDGPPFTVEAIHGAETRVLAVSYEPDDESLLLGAPGRQWTDPHGLMRLAAVLEVEKRLLAAVTRAVPEADASAMAGEGVEHD